MRHFLLLIVIVTTLVVAHSGKAAAPTTQPGGSGDFNAILQAIKKAPDVGPMNLVATSGAENVVITDADDPQTQLGLIPRDRWVEFVQVAVAQAGLRDFVTTQGLDGETFVLLGFTRPESTLRLADKSVKLTERFWSRMEVPLKYSEERKPGKPHSVILVHDPHDAVAARFHLVNGLRALIEANPDKAFAFLVEGDYTPMTKTIPTDIIGKALVGGAPNRAQMLYLLKETWIDSALTYRLLYPLPVVDAVAIDDPKLIREDIEQLRTVGGGLDGEAILKAFRRVSELKSNLTKADNVNDDALVNLLDVTLINARSLVGSHDDPTTFRRMAVAAGQLADQLTSRNDNTHGDAITALRQIVVEATSCDRALQRDVTMARNIREYAKENSKVIPIAFIGSFHTDGLIRHLKDDFDCAVFEPYESRNASPEDRNIFNNRLLGRSTTRPNSPVPSRPHPDQTKIWGTPTPEYVPAIRKDLTDFSGKFSMKLRDAEQAGIASNRSSDAVTVAQELSATRERNIKAVSGGGAKVPPNDGAFGGFDPMEVPKSGQSVWYMPPADAEWDRRVSFMKETLARPPPWWQKESSLKAVKFSPGADGSIAAFAVYEGKTNAVRFFDGEAVGKDLASIVALPKYRAESKARIYFQRLSLDTVSKGQEKYRG